MRLFRYLLYPLAIFHWIIYKLSASHIKNLIDSDIIEMNQRLHTKGKGLFYWLIFEQPYRNLFYYRIPKARFLRIVLRQYPLFIINTIEGIGGSAFVLNHPYATIINARSIGRNFTVCQLTTIGNSKHGHNDLIPTIGNNVSIGANVTIIGNISVGDNVTIGAGSVVVKNVPSNCIVAGNPARIIKMVEEI